MRTCGLRVSHHSLAVLTSQYDCVYSWISLEASGPPWLTTYISMSHLTVASNGVLSRLSRWGAQLSVSSSPSVIILTNSLSSGAPRYCHEDGHVDGHRLSPPGVRFLCSRSTSVETCQWRRPRALAALFPALDIVTPTVTYPWYWCALINTLRREKWQNDARVYGRLSFETTICVQRPSMRLQLGGVQSEVTCIEGGWQRRADVHWQYQMRLYQFLATIWNW